MRSASLASGAIVALALVWNAAPTINPASAEEPSKAELDAALQALEKYKDPYVAIRDLYLSKIGRASCRERVL